MRINKFIAQATGVSRRAADELVRLGRVTINGHTAELSNQATPDDTVKLDDTIVRVPEHTITIVLNKPVGYVCSRDGQGAPTIYDLLPPEYQRANPVGRLDKDSSGLIVLSTDGDLAYQYSHPKFNKDKIYEVVLQKSLENADAAAIQKGVVLEDGLSKLALQAIPKPGTTGTVWRVTMHEGRNRQIRRTFEARGYSVSRLHRVHFGPYQLRNLKSGSFEVAE